MRKGVKEINKFKMGQYIYYNNLFIYNKYYIV
jgi:hypothetical protein